MQIIKWLLWDFSSGDEKGGRAALPLVGKYMHDVQALFLELSKESGKNWKSPDTVLCYSEGPNYKYWKKKKVSEGDFLRSSEPQQSLTSLFIPKCVYWKRQSKPRKRGSKQNPRSSPGGQPCSRFCVLFLQHFFQELKLPVPEKEDAHPAVASFWIAVVVVTSRIGAGDVFSFSSRSPPISEPSDSEFLPLPSPSPRTYLCSTHSPCQLWELQRSRQPGMGTESSHCSAIERNHDDLTERLTTHIPKNPAVQILTSLVQSTGSTLDSVFYLFCYGGI